MLTTTCTSLSAILGAYFATTFIIRKQKQKRWIHRYWFMFQLNNGLKQVGNQIKEELEPDLIILYIHFMDLHDIIIGLFI